MRGSFRKSQETQQSKIYEKSQAGADLVRGSVLQRYLTPTFVWF